MMTKTSAYRIRLDPELHQQFLEACKSQDKPAAQVLREFMQRYISENLPQRQGDLFGAFPVDELPRTNG